MGGGGSGDSKSSSKSEATPEQKMMWSYMMTDMIPITIPKTDRIVLVV